MYIELFFNKKITIQDGGTFSLLTFTKQMDRAKWCMVNLKNTTLYSITLLCARLVICFFLQLFKSAVQVDVCDQASLLCGNIGTKNQEILSFHSLDI